MRHCIALTCWVATVAALICPAIAHGEVLVLRSSTQHLETYQQPIHVLVPAPSVLTPDVILAARAAPLAREVAGGIPSTWVSPIALDPYAVWINATGNLAQGPDALYSIDFDVTDSFTSASLNMTYAVDNVIGTGGTTDGVLLNGSPLPGSYGGTHERESIQNWIEVGGLLHVGRNSLLIRVHNGGLETGITFHIIIATSGPPSEPLQLSLSGPPLAKSGSPIRLNLQALNYTGARIPLALIIVQVGSADAIITPNFNADQWAGLPAPEASPGAFVFQDVDQQFVAFFVGGIPSALASDLGSIDMQLNQLGPHGEARPIPVTSTIVPITMSTSPPSPRVRNNLVPADIDCLVKVFDHSMFDPFDISLADASTTIACGDALFAKATTATLLEAFALVGGADYIAMHKATFGQVMGKAFAQGLTCLGTGYISAQLAKAGYMGMVIAGLKELVGGLCVYQNFQTCGGPISGPCGRKLFTWVGSLDPNEKGGSGRGLSSGYVRADAETLQFEIHYENAPSASSPARSVAVIDTVDGGAFDVSGMQLGNVAFGRRQASLALRPLGGVTFVDLRPEKNVLVAVSASVSTVASAKVIRWDMRTVDPGTLLPPSDPLAGFLPADVSPPEGLGDVQFSIPLKPGLPEGQVVRNRASIVFDNNPPILTNDWKRVVDRQPPQVGLSLIRTSGADATIRLVASDGVSGVAGLSLSVGLDGVDYVLREWRDAGAVDTTMMIVGLPRGEALFKAVATDRAGNAMTAGAELDVAVQYGPTAPTLSVWPNPCRGNCLLRAGPTSARLAGVRIVDVTGRRIRDLEINPSLGARQAQWDGLDTSGAPAPSGLYLLLARGVDGSLTRRRIAVVR